MLSDLNLWVHFSGPLLCLLKTLIVFLIYPFMQGQALWMTHFSLTWQSR